MHTYIVELDKGTHKHMRTPTHMYAHTHTHTHTHACTHTTTYNIHIHTHFHTYIHTYEHSSHTPGGAQEKKIMRSF